jgi:hypothetical protein
MQIETDRIDSGDTKRITVTPSVLGGGGTAAPDELTVTVREYRADAVTYDLDDGLTASGGSYYFDHTFTAPGQCRIEAVMVDSAGRRETTRSRVMVY